MAHASSAPSQISSRPDRSRSREHTAIAASRVTTALSATAIGLWRAIGDASAMSLVTPPTDEPR